MTRWWSASGERSNTVSISCGSSLVCTLGDMSLSQLRYFVAVAEEGHVGRAARALHVSQPPLSRQIKLLEDELGAPLFQRTPRGMKLLPAGATLLGYAQQILSLVDSAASALRERPEGR